MFAKLFHRIGDLEFETMANRLPQKSRWRVIRGAAEEEMSRMRVVARIGSAAGR